MPRKPSPEKTEFITYPIRVDKQTYERVKQIVEFLRELDKTMSIHRYMVEAVKYKLKLDWITYGDLVEKYHESKNQVVEVGGTSE